MLIQCAILDAIKTLSSTLIRGLFGLSSMPLNSTGAARHCSAPVLKTNLDVIERHSLLEEFQGFGMFLLISRIYCACIMPYNMSKTD